MNNSWKRRVFSTIALSALFVAVLLSSLVPTAQAAVTPVAESGGKHWRFETAAHGPVHVWAPGSYDPSTAITVVHVHGVAESYVGSYVPTKYSDKAWPAMRLAEQFKATGLNALFIFPDGPTTFAELSADTRTWKSLDGLLDAVKNETGQIVPQKVLVSGHSGAYATIQHWTGNSRVAAFVLLDSTYDAASTYYGWFKGGTDRRLAVVHTNTLASNGKTAVQAKKIAAETRAKILARIPDSTTDLTSQAGTNRAVVMQSQFDHPGIISSYKVIPVVLPWAAQHIAGSAAGSPSPTTPTGSPSGGSGGLVTIPGGPITYDGPDLEIPIPGIEFSSIINQNGEITIPWLAQYVGGAYTFLLSIAGLIAAVMMVVGGFQYVTSGGDKGKVGEGKKKIINALTGLVLALGSYTILYSINPDLVEFKGLTISTANTIAWQAEDDSNAEDESGLIDSSATGTVPTGEFGQPKAICNSEATCKPFCDQYYANDPSLPLAAPGMAKATDVQLIPDTAGVNGFGNSASPTVVGLLKIAGPMFANRGYKLAVTSGYRDLRGQLRVACNAWKKGQGSKVGKTIAWPGGSFHGVGYAIDVQLYRIAVPKNLKVTTSGNSTVQNTVDAKYASDLADIMLKAGFRRLNNEIWHFEPANAPKPAKGCRCYTLDKCPMPPNVKDC